MKPRELLHFLGLRARLRPKPVLYGYQIRPFDLPTDGQIEYAQWLHPGETDKVISQAAVDELRTFIEPGMVAIDIGAHTGDSTIPIALACGGQGLVLALEPNPYVFAVLQRNAELNRGKTNILPLMVAATPEDQDYEFQYSDAGFCNGGWFEGLPTWRHGHVFSLVVHGKNLRSLLEAEYPTLLPRVRYLKIDAEGQDYRILTGLPKLLRDCRPYLRLEIFKHSPPEERHQLFHFLTERGYLIHRVTDETSYCGERVAAPQDLQKWRHFDIFCTPARPG